MLKIYNSITKQKEEFKPITPGKVGLYVCGMTVYDFCHIGHARVMVNFDYVVRYFRYRGLEVNYVRNITDIDDKIIARANKNGESMGDLTARFIGAMHEDARRLNIQSPNNEPKATDYVPQIIQMIETLIDKGFAYVNKSGDVLCEIKCFENYGKMAHKDLDDLQAGARVAITENKRSPLDFVLWKMAKPDEPSWDSPWGKGRPGWHIECSAMATSCIDHSIDIHGGGADLKFPHHENEIAQSEAATDKPFVNYWIHVGFVTVNKEKMSKSLGNFFTIREVMEKYHPEVIRYFMVSSHYRSPVNYSQESLDIASGALLRFYNTLRDVPIGDALDNTDYEKQFIDAMDDDFNTPEALAALFEISHEINRVRDTDPARTSSLAGLLKKLGGVLGIITEDPNSYLQDGHGFDEATVQKIEKLIADRNAARAAKDWAEADRVRADLTDMGIILEDDAEGTKWRQG